MLVRFSSVKTESVMMFGDAAMQLINMLGGSNAMPGAIGAEDILAAVKRLRQQLLDAANAASTDAKDAEDEKDREPPIALATRAGPLIDILERAAAADAPVMWEKV